MVTSCATKDLLPNLSNQGGFLECTVQGSGSSIALVMRFFPGENQRGNEDCPPHLDGKVNFSRELIEIIMPWMGIFKQYLFSSPRRNFGFSRWILNGSRVMLKKKLLGPLDPRNTALIVIKK